MVYVLQLVQGKYYIGHTDATVEERIERHRRGIAAAWTRRYPPLALVEVRAGGLNVERATTLEYMRKYGWRNVRGAGWATADLARPPSPLSTPGGASPPTPQPDPTERQQLGGLARYEQELRETRRHTRKIARARRAGRIP